MAELDPNKHVVPPKEMENELHLKKLQIKSLLAITQAINHNLSSDALYGMYKTFISWDMKVSKMILLIKDGEEWVTGTRIEAKPVEMSEALLAALGEYKRMQKIRDDEANNWLCTFDVIIPVYHKEVPIAFSLIAGVNDEKDLNKKVQFIQTITNIISVAIENKRMFRAQIRQERLNQSLMLAEEVQQLLLPRDFPKTEEYELDGIYHPHLEVGGDYFDYHVLDEDQFVFCIADISGKGIGAAMLMANFQALLKSNVKYEPDMLRLVRNMNKSVYELVKGDRFITFFVAKVNTKKRNIQYINAGHCRPIMFNKGKTQLLHKGCTMLGLSDEMDQIELGIVNYEPNTIIMSYTDGITEAQNESGDYFDEDHLRIFSYSIKEYSASGFNKALLRRLDSFIGSESSYADDLAVLTCFLK